MPHLNAGNPKLIWSIFTFSNKQYLKKPILDFWWPFTKQPTSEKKTPPAGQPFLQIMYDFWEALIGRISTTAGGLVKSVSDRRGFLRVFFVKNTPFKCQRSVWDCNTDSLNSPSSCSGPIVSWTLEALVSPRNV